MKLVKGIMLIALLTAVLAGTARPLRANDDHTDQQQNAADDSAESLSVSPSSAEAEQSNDARGPSGLPLPRFASLRFHEVNLRTGPGTRYPIDWVYIRAGIPVEITAEFDVWRRIRDWEGTEGWVQKSSLIGKRAAVVLAQTVDLKKDEAVTAQPVAHVQTGAVGHLLSCAKDWCQLKFGSVKGYLPKDAFWGSYPNEEF